jgi:hypothetical protein
MPAGWLGSGAVCPRTDCIAASIWVAADPSGGGASGTTRPGAVTSSPESGGSNRFSRSWFSTVSV